MEISSLELAAIVSRLNKELSPPDGRFYLNNVYSIFSDVYLFRFHHSSFADKNVVIAPSMAVWMTKYSFEERETGGYTLSLRRSLERARFIAAEQPHGERIVILTFETGAGSTRLVCEFFREGNLVILSEDSRIISCLRRISVRHREVAPGREYVLPPSKGASIFELDRTFLDGLLRTDLQASKWLGRNLSLSRKYTEEILARASIPPDAAGSSLRGEDLDQLFDVAKKIADDARAPESGAFVLYEGDTPLDVTPSKFVTMNRFQEIRVESMIDAVDEVFTHEIRTGRRERDQSPGRQKLEQLERSIGMQREAGDRATRSAAELRSLARSLGQHQRESLEDLLKELDIVYEVTRPGSVTLFLEGDKIDVENAPPMRVSSQLFSEAKILESRARAIREAEGRLQEERERVSKDLALITPSEKPQAKIAEPWFARYRWFFTSNGLLAIGGRDAHSNSTIIRKHMKPGDLVFHAEIVGSPFFVLKGASEEDDTSILEVAKAVVSFSRAWREGIVGDAYWIKPEQVKMHAPSGTYLPKGSFLIEGKKNFVKGIVPEVGVGVGKIDGRGVLMSGPVGAISRNSIAYLMLVPERSKISETAKGVKREIVALLDGEIAEIYKTKPLDDFVRVLPPGGGRITLKMRGEQKG